MEVIQRKIILIFIIALIGCSVKTTNAEEAFKYWSGNEPPKEINLIKGQYYRSPHFTSEYELFLKFKSEETWFDRFVENNKLSMDTGIRDWNKWADFPDWFHIDSTYSIYTKDPNDQFEHSRYFINPKTGICYIYETVGM